MRIQLPTSAGLSKFEFEGSISEGTHIYYGNGHESTVTKDPYEQLLSRFKGKTVKIGTSRCNTLQGSLGE